MPALICGTGMRRCDRARKHLFIMPYKQAVC